MRFGFGGIVGGPDASHVSEYSSELLRLVREYAGRDYCPDLGCLGFGFDVDGSLFSKGKKGVGSTRYFKRHHMVSTDICIPVEMWEGRTPAQIREYIGGCFLIALDKTIKRAIKAGFVIEEDALRRDIARAMVHFLEQEGEPNYSESHYQILNASKKTEELLALKRLLEK